MSGGALSHPPLAALFGKLPAHGDFVRRGDPVLALRLDAWLTCETDRLAAMLGDELDARLEQLPTWCFVLAEGMAGALAASSDRVGRLYPLVACAQGSSDVAVRIADMLETARAEKLDADMLVGMMGASDTFDREDATKRAGWWCHADVGQSYPEQLELPTGTNFMRLFLGAD